MKFFNYVFLFFIFSGVNTYSQRNSEHKVVSGDSFYSIAKKYNIDEEDIYKLNPQVKGTVLQLNTVLVVPNKKKTATSKTSEHRIEANETLSSISRKYDLSLEDLKALNPDINPNKLKIGDVLNLKKSKNNSKNSKIKNENLNENGFHSVSKGETLNLIAEKYNLGLSELKALNPNISSKIQIGQKLVIQKKKKAEKPIVVEKNPISEVVANNSTSLNLAEVTLEDETEEPDDSGEIYHIINKGETLNSIARKYEIKLSQLKKLNPKQGDKLAVGNKLLIKKSDANLTEIKPPVVYAEVEEYVEDAPELNNESLKYADFLISKASENIGTRYRSGGTSPGGFDCSGLMCYLFNELEFKLPRTSSEQSQFGKKVKKAKAQKGDLIFFATNGRGSVSHVGMVTDVTDDEIKFIHSSTSNGVVISSLNETYYARRFVRINRVLDKL